MTRYPAAEQLARYLVIPVDATLEGSLALWAVEYASTHAREPDATEASAAGTVLEQRLDGVVPEPPPSASSSAWAMPRLTRLTFAS